MESSSSFRVWEEFSQEWSDVSESHRRSHTVIYTASRYGRRFLLKTIPPEDAHLTEYRQQQEREFQIGVQLVHPNIAATYSLEEVEGVGRCIVQEWIDGVTLGEWLASNPSREERERVVDQLLDVLEYVHSFQLVHHDLKSDNIMVTRHGANVKLIDFGLSATDSTLSPVANAPQIDIRAVGRIMPLIVGSYKLLSRRISQGRYRSITSVKRAIQARRKCRRWLPVVIATVLLLTAMVLSFIAWQQQYSVQQKSESTMAQVEEILERESKELAVLAHQPRHFDKSAMQQMEEYNKYIEEYNNIRHRYWLVRDSLIKSAEGHDQLQEEIFSAWTRREVEIDAMYYTKLLDKINH